MSRSQYSAHWAFSAFAAFLLMAPLLKAMHHHEVDHDGATLHIETDHGGHFHPPAELDERQVATAPAASAVPATAWELPETPSSAESVPAGGTVEHPPRPPPSPLHPRPPPFLA